MDRQNVDRQVRPFLEGKAANSFSDASFDVDNPSNGECCVSIPVGSQRDVDLAVASARGAFEDGRWTDTSLAFRKQALHRFSDLISKNATLLDALDAEEMGKPIGLEFCNAAAAGSFVEFYAEAVDKVMGDVYASDKKSFVAQSRVPRGVVAAVVPWNFPTFNAVLKVAPALAAGNCVVLKPSEMSSRSAIRLAHLAIEAGIPAGVLNVVPGVGEIVGRALGLHQDVDMLTFTGSTDVGKLMMQYAGQSNMKVLMTECGGKSPYIVFDDGVDLDVAAESVAQLLITNQGQVCSVGSRLLVQNTIANVMIEKIVDRLKGIAIGSALDPKTTFGPLVSAKQCERVLEYIDSGEKEGARLVLGGARIRQETGGYFVEPSVFAGVSPTARIAREEIFGPVLSVIPFCDEAEAVRIANGTMYGLAAYIWTASLSTGMRMAKGIRSSVYVNSAASTGEGPGFAFSHEPTRQSGFGSECGLAGLESYLRRQLVWFAHG